MNKKDFLTRATAGLIYVVVLLLGIFGGKYSFLLVFGSILGLALYEFYRMVEKNTTHAISKIFNIASGIFIFLSAYLYLEEVNVYVFAAASLAYLLALFATAIFINRPAILPAIIYSVFGQIYITLPLALLMLISYQYNVSVEGYHYVLVLAVFVFIWVNDTAAYLIGSLLGKHKLIKRISPKKSIEGFVAGIIFALIAGLVFARFFPEYPSSFWMGYAFTASLFGTLGDLFESLIKRIYGVKDAGDIMPGHGGILDRIDSTLIAIPAVYLYLMIFIELLPSMH